MLWYEQNLMELFKMYICRFICPMVFCGEEQPESFCDVGNFLRYQQVFQSQKCLILLYSLPEWWRKKIKLGFTCSRVPTADSCWTRPSWAWSEHGCDWHLPCGFLHLLGFQIHPLWEIAYSVTTAANFDWKMKMFATFSYIHKHIVLGKYI